MIESKIIGLFPTPVYISELNRPLTTEENFFIEKNKLDVHNNEGNKTSNDNYILNNKAFKDIKQELELRVQDYFDKIISSTNNITPYITQSWLNYTETNQYHHKHAHANSLVSGVFYIDCKKEYDKIIFFKNIYNPIKLDTKEFNEFNSESWYIEVNTGQIVLFPSFLEHMVEIKKGNNTRISLAFNVFVKGTLGNKKKLTELILNNY
jgi:uncharacterized protein (TIGR02466 family)